MNLEKEASQNNPLLEFSPLALSDIKGTWLYLAEQNEEAAAHTVKQILEK